jgi:phosphoglucosamine mutase
VRVTPGFDWQTNAALVAEKTQVEKELAGQGRVLIRASGTEPLVRVMVETSDAEIANNMARRLANCIV